MLAKRFIQLAAAAIVAVGVAAQKVSITGASVPAGASIPIRKNINDLRKEGGAAWDLYIRAMLAMQETNYENQLSYFQIAGIHGKPFIEWNGGGSRAQTSDWQGYCPHGEKLFMPWHRPYVLLYEQILVDNAKRLAAQYPSRYRATYTKAAETLRAPYWDWAADARVPDAIIPTTMSINYPDGENLKARTVGNPLNTFKFPGAVLDGKYGQWDSSRRTQIYRCPAPNTFPNSANALLAKRPYKRWIYDVFTRSKDFTEFASTSSSGTSLELIHNGIHWDATCAGQFLATEFSAFDPIFMLHHANIDRFWALWQATYPKHSRFSLTYTGGARYSTPKGTGITPDSPLNPFFQKNGQLHTTKSVEKIQNFGYTYQGLDFKKSAAQMTADAKALINRLYGTTAAVSSSRMRLQSTGQSRYFVKLSLDVTQVERPCVVNIFVEGEEVGNMVVMKQPSSGITNGAFDLDDAVAVSNLGSLSPDAAIKAIQGSLEISIAKPDGGEIPVASVTSLKVSVEHVVVTPPTSETELPQFGPTTSKPAPSIEQADTAKMRARSL